MPPEAMTLMYAAAKGISRSKVDERSLALEVGIKMKRPITINGAKSKIIAGNRLNSNKRTTPTTDKGIVHTEKKSISET
jgi:hypothetical protein